MDLRSFFHVSFLDHHLWIDHEFIDPALDTLRGSVAQVQAIENRMLVLKATYQDHQG